MEVKTLTTAAFQLGEPLPGLWYCARSLADATEWDIEWKRSHC